MNSDSIIVVILLIALIGGGYTAIVYLRNKQTDRARHRREKLEEKREELMDSIRNKNDEDEH